MVRVVCLWQVADFNRQKLPFSLEMVLLDGKGDKIHASVRKTLVYKFEKELREGSVYSISFLGVASNGGSFRTTRHPYRLNFQFATKLFLVDQGLVPSDIFTFVPFADIFSRDCDMDYLVGDLKVECTLFGSYVDDLNSFLASGETKTLWSSFSLPRYHIRVRVIDETDSATFVIFDCDATVLLNKSCAEMLESLDKDAPTRDSYLFDKKTPLLEDVSNAIGQNLLPKFTEAVV
ncbi:Replication protein A 70 kDa DNA-binding subunit [Spatholobus suberectus]|nr:Replication protein A 70 kDa DNA-binding subunit [Spatholobus suberectus]